MDLNNFKITIMSTEELEGNKLIADFMGVKIELNYEDNTVVKGYKMLTASANKVEPFVYIQPTFMHVAPLDSKNAIEEMVSQKIWRNIERLSKYHSSWDWQIPVWAKVAHLLKELLPKLQKPEEKIKYYFQMLRLYEKAVFNNEPESGQKVIVDLIKFYNQHRQ